MVDILNSIIIGAIQGITEWLPISSTAHLYLAEKILKISLPINFTLFLHLGTSLALIIYFHNEIRNIIFSIFKKDEQNFNQLKNLLLGTLFTIPTGLFLKYNTPIFLSTTKGIGISLIINGIIIYLTRFCRSTTKIKKLDAIIIGLSQGLSVIPGISRSGITISTALLKNINIEHAVKFSFLLSLPTILGLTLLEFSKLKPVLDFSIFIGMSTAFIISLLVIKHLINIVINKKFYLFSYYTILLGLLLLLL